MKNLTIIIFTLLNFFSAALSHAKEETHEHRTSVGVGLSIDDVEIAGGKLIAIPRVDAKVPIILRIVKTEQTEKGYLYSFYVEGLDPGKYDLATFLKREDKGDQANEDILSIPFEVYSLLDDPLAVTEPRPLEMKRTERIGGYKKLLWVLGIIWCIGLLVLIYVLWLRKKLHTQEEESVSPPTLAERIVQLLRDNQSDQSIEMSAENKAKLERMVIGHWMEKFPELEGKTVAQSLVFLRNHEQSSPMMRSIETWLHSNRAASEISEEEVHAALAPYMQETQHQTEEATR